MNTLFPCGYALSLRRRARASWVAWMAIGWLAAGAGSAAPASERADRDFDGIADRQDGCPASPRGAAPIAEGCSALEIALAPERFVDPIRSQLDERAAVLADDPLYADAGRTLGDASAAFAEAAAVLRAGEVCRAADLFDAAASNLEEAEASFESTIRAQASSGLPRGAMSRAFLHLRQSLTQEAIEQARTAAGYVRAACGQVVAAGPLRGQVAAVDDASRTFRFAGPRTPGVVGIAEGRLPAGLMAGRRIDGRGLRFADGTALLTSLRDELPISGGAKTTPCLTLRVAPFQQFPPYKEPLNQPYRLRPTAGYAQGMYGTLNLERFQRLAAETATTQVGGVPAGCATSSGSQTFSFAMKIDVSQGGNTWTIASDLQDGDVPVGLPSSLIDGQLATVAATTLKTACIVGFGCTAPQTQATETLSLVMRPFGSYAVIAYTKTIFDVGGNVGIGDFEPAKVSNVTLSNVPDPSPTFSAMGYKITNNNPSDTPKGVLVTDNFAVYEIDDLYDETAAVKSMFGGLAEFLIHGVDHVAALNWPQLTGHNSTNGETFEYSATLPKIVRDRVKDCAGSLDSFYDLPYLGGFPVWILTKGNFDDPTAGFPNGAHKFALQFAAASGSDVYAARGGVVTMVEESKTTNDPDLIDASSTGNWVSIKHEDGTYGFYFHLAKDGVLVKKGDRVFRNTHIAEVGENKLVFEVGNQCPPHQCTSLAGYQTVKALYEFREGEPAGGVGAWVPGDLVDCQVPRVDDPIFHN